MISLIEISTFICNFHSNVFSLISFVNIDITWFPSGPVLHMMIIFNLNMDK